MSFKLFIFGTIIFGIITIICAIYSIKCLKKESSPKSSILSIIISVCSLIVTLLASFQIKIPSPIILPLDNEIQIYENNVEISIDSVEKDCNIYYSLDGSDPKNDGIKYNESFSISDSTTICARNKFIVWWSDISKGSYKFKELEYQSTDSQSTVSSIDIEKEIKHIQDRYYSLPEPSSLPEPTSNQPIKKCYDNNMKIIKVYRGYNNINYSRMYYYDENDKLYFALIYFKNEIENRLYFKDDCLIRYIDKNSVIHDSDKEIIVCEWTEFALKDSYEVLIECK